MKKLIFVIIPLLLIILLIYLVIQHVNNMRTQKGALQVTSTPSSKVYLNDKYLGRTPVSKTEANDMIQSGNYTLKLVPEDTSLSEYQEKITISTGILTVVDRKFRKGALSEGSVISLTPLSDKEKTELEVISFPSGSRVLLDANAIGNTPLLFKNPTESDHILKVNKNGYKGKTIRIRTPKGYRLTIIGYLSIASENGEEQVVPDPSTSPSITLTPSPSPAKVLILETPTGFLRVRQTNDLNSEQISTVNPGDTFPFVSEQPGWYQIKLSDGKTGWVSSEFAKKQ